jgi:chromosome segregation ATPase
MSTVSNEITTTIVDANHPRLQGLQSLFRLLHLAWERLELDGREEAEAANTLHTDLGAEIEGPNLRLTLEAIGNLERRCHLLASHLHETALRLVFPGIASGFRNDLDAAVAELRANAVAQEGQLDRAHDWVELHRERITELTTRLGNLTHSRTGTIPRMKDRIRALEDDNHHLREAIDELRGEIQTLRTAREAAGNRTPVREAAGNRTPV